MKLFAVYDTKAEAFSPPIMTGTKSLAIRDFSDAANNEQSNISKYPSDFTLYEIAEYDQNTGIISAYANKIQIANATEFKQNLKVVN